MKPFAIADCETDPFKAGRVPQPFIWGLYFPDIKHFEKFATAGEMMEYLKGQDLRVYFHNGGKFDYHYMIDYIPTWEKIVMINGRIAQWRYKNLEFVDSYCILPVALDRYKKTKIDYNIFEAGEREKPENKALIESYLKDDCVFLSELVGEFLKENGFALTIASSAIKKLQKIEGLKIHDQGRGFFDAIRPYFYGGRVECFKKGIIKSEITYLDINSAYPYAMTHEHPINGFITTYDKNPEIKGHNFYKLQAKSLGVFPFREKNKTLSFPNDGKERIFCISGWEVLAAMELDKLKNAIHIEQKIFLETVNFQKYVNHWYEIKQTAPKNSPLYIFAKLYLNSAYGKFAANPEKYKTTYIIEQNDFAKAVIEGFTVHGELHDKLIISKATEASEWRHYNIATGASITGFVRAMLAKSIAKVEKPIYCDTDSLIFTGKHSLKLGEALGDWKIEGVFNSGGIGGKKIYAFENEKMERKTACKGARLSYDEILSVCRGEKIEHLPDVPIYSIKKGIYFQKKSIAMT